MRFVSFRAAVESETWIIPQHHNDNGNASTPIGWTYANQYGASAGGIVRDSCGVGEGGSYGSGFCWYDGAIQAYDAISQTIQTNINDTYQISFWVADNSFCRTDGGGPACNFSDTSTNGDTIDSGGNGINVTVYAQAGLPPPTQQLTVTLLDSGTGNVTDNSTPTPLINCSESNGTVTGTCSANYPYQTLVTLTATPTPPTTFAGWGGACGDSGTNPSCTVTMNAAQSVTASFVLPGQTQTGTVATGTQTDFTYTTYNYNAKLTSGNPVSAAVTAIPIQDQATCNAIVNPTFPGAQCFVFDDGNGPGVPAPVMFELTCPDSPGGTCGSADNQNFFATLGTAFNFTKTLNPYNRTEPLVGWLKGAGSDPVHPCTLNPGNSPALFQSNQIVSFFTVGDPQGNAKGSSGGTGSCWLLTYSTPYEAPSVNITAPANGGSYIQGSSQPASYSCTAVNNSNINNGVAGPYLTENSCNGPVASGSPFSTSTPGPNTFTVTMTDSAANTTSSTVTYLVEGPPLISSPNSVTFTIGLFGSFTVTTSGYPTPSITEVGPLPNGLVFVDNGNGTGTLQGTPLVFIGGDFSISFTATNGIGSPATQAFTIILQQAPSITSANNATFAFGVPNSFTVTTTGFPTPSIAKAGGLPAGVTFVDNGNGTGTLSGTPSVAGTFPIVFTATNAVTTTPQNFTLTVAGLSISPSPLNFGTVYLNTSHTLSVTLTNMGKSAVTISGVSITPGTAPAAAYTYVSHCTTPLTAGKSCTIAVTFLADAVGTLTATLNITDNTVGSPQHVSLTGNVIDPVAQLNPARLTFGTQAVGSHTTLPVQLTNTGLTPLIISNIAIVGSGEFTEVNNCPAILSSTMGCTISVTFAPTVKGARTGTLTITDNVQGGQSTVALTGTGQ